MYSIEESDATRREYHLRLIEIKKKTGLSSAPTKRLQLFEADTN